jgi:hypothetical protein
MAAARHAAERAQFTGDLDGEAGQAMLQRQMEECYAAQRQDYEASLQQQEEQASSSSPSAMVQHARTFKREAGSDRDAGQVKKRRR